MDSRAESKARIGCPGCSKALMVPVSASGKKAKCPGCGKQFKIPALGAARPAASSRAAGSAASAARTAAPQAAARPTAKTDWLDDLEPEYRLQPSEPSGSAQTVDPQRLAYAAEHEAAHDALQRAQHGETVAPSRSSEGMSSSILGGICLMGIAVLWFFGGLAAGYIFFYPPILFVAGLIGVVKGLFEQ